MKSVVYLSVLWVISKATGNISLGTWTTGSSKIPITDYDMASFLYNNTIYLFGGAGSKRNKQLIEFDVSTQSFTNVGDILSVPCEGDAQFYTQINNMGYWAGETTISRYDLQSKQLFPDDVSGVNNTMGDVCLASHNNLLFVVGGSYDTHRGTYPILRKVEIYNISSQMWLYGAPAMNRPRSSLTCIVHPEYDTLYSIGGHNLLYPSLDHEIVIEKLYIDDDILNNPWIETSHSLLIGVVKARSVIYQHYIVVIGGVCNYYPTDICPGTVNAVQLIDVITDQVSYGPALNTAIEQCGAVYNSHDNTIYVFGGYVTDTYSYLRVETNPPTNAPTSSPTASPSNHPTAKPTPSPTNKPTRDPTEKPTDDPTTAPSSAPTINPTSSPTVSPSRYPTNYPTAVPTIYPTESPTNSPSDSPVKHPTAAPTVHPTPFPSEDPTLSPTKDPTSQTVNPSPAPTHNSTTAPTDNPTVFEKSTALPTDDNEPNNNGDGQSNGNHTVDIILIVLFAALFVFFLCLWLKTRNEKNALLDSISNPNDGGPYIAMTDNDDDDAKNIIQ